MNSDTADPFHPDNLRTPPEMLAELVAKNGEVATARKPKRQRCKSREIQFFNFPASVLQAVRNVNRPRGSSAVYDIMFAIYDLRYSDLNHSQTVKLTSAALERYGVSRKKKRQVLQILVKSGQYAVEYRADRESPWVTELWRPFWK